MNTSTQVPTAVSQPILFTSSAVIFGVVVSWSRFLKRLSRHDLSYRAQIGHQMLRRIEDGGINPSLNMLSRLAYCLDTTEEGLFARAAAIRRIVEGILGIRVLHVAGPEMAVIRTFQRETHLPVDAANMFVDGMILVSMLSNVKITPESTFQLPGSAG